MARRGEERRGEKRIDTLPSGVSLADARDPRRPRIA